MTGVQTCALPIYILKPYNINARTGQDDIRYLFGTNSYLVNITNKERPVVSLPNDFIIKDYMFEEDGSLFPYYDTSHHWSADNYGPMMVPKKGASIALNADNLIRYQRCIEVYEGNKFENKNEQYFINGTPATSYKFKMNYFFMMGDNRHNSLDSRYWGFVPEDHVVGKASLIWFSWEGGPRWKRIFNSIK